MTQKSPKISKNNVNSIYDQTCSECNDEVIDQLRPKMKMMTNDDTKISKITKKCLVLFTLQGLVASQEPRPSERTLSTDLFNPFGNKSVLLDRLDGRYHSSLPKNQCSISNGFHFGILF